VSPSARTILGLSAYHADAAAAAVVDGRFVAGVEEERFRRIKHWAGFPELALRWCVEEAAGGDARAIDAFAVARRPRAYLGRKAWLALTHPRSLPRAAGRLENLLQIEALAGRVGATLGLAAAPRLVTVEHHEAHLASAFFCSPFEEAVCLSVDGFGDFVSTMLARGRGNRIEVLDRVCFPHSLGVFYTALTQFLGFLQFGDEYKVMGLAAFGEPRYARELAALVPARSDGTFRLDLDYFRHLSEGVEMSWEEGAPAQGLLFSPELEARLGPRRRPDDEIDQRHMDLAASLQAVYEERFFALVRAALAAAGSKRLALAGGCAMNSLANGKLFERTEVEEIYIQAAAGDAGTALGAALWAHHVELGAPRDGFVMEHAAWGPQHGEREVRAALAAAGSKRLALAGGCAMNSLANGKLFERTEVEEIYIQAAAGDAGTALGAALWAHHVELGAPRDGFVMEHAAWGPQHGEREVRAALAVALPGSYGQDGRFEIADGAVEVTTAAGEEALCRDTARALAAGEVVGWFQGRAEWGPRALGHRSILADPRRADMKELLNAKIKRRESFRPFAPSILEERVGEWFTIGYPDPFMLKVYPVRPGRRAQIPAVTHVDGTGRLQTVAARTEPLYARLIRAFEAETGVPILLNTSFNENEPIVNAPGEALDCFLRTQMDRLVMGSVYLRRVR